MICYKDRSFCSKSSHCMNTKCDRLLTDEESNAADKWARDSGLDFTPISFGDFSSPDCGYMEKKLEQGHLE